MAKTSDAKAGASATGPTRSRATGPATTRDGGATRDGGDWTAEEREAMQERAREAKRARSGGKTDGAADLLAKVAEMEPGERAIATRLHELITEHAPQLEPRTWYGMPAWAIGGKVLCFFQPGTKFKSRYSTLGFQDPARLDDGAMWPTSFALVALDAAAEKQILSLLTRALG